ncbi:MAG: hypothetical protein KBT28_10755 [Bacteroidales bacterium]|nr:hypothetical protein [Candidatus Colimorpha merdihippi]
MTILEAIMAECEPYTASVITYEKALADGELSGADTYYSDMKGAVARCAISVLTKMLPLTSDSTGSSSQGYNREGLVARISAICRENGFEESDFCPVPTVEVYHNLF